MGRLQELAALARESRLSPPRAVRGWRDVGEAIRLHPIARRLAPTFSEPRLRADLGRLDPSWWTRHQGPYHDGNWESIALWAPRGDRREQRSFGGAFAPTEALERCPYFAEVMAAFPCRKSRVRLMRLRGGGRILPHSDPMHQIDPNLVRLHVPILTSPAVTFLVAGRLLTMHPGEVWHVDVRFRHEVHNAGVDDRVHLVLDLVVNSEVSSLLRDADVVGRGFLASYYLRHSLPPAWRHRLGLGT